MRPAAALGALAAVALALAAAPAWAAPPPAGVVAWTPDGPKDGYDGPTPFKVRRVARGDHVRGLPVAARQIEPRWSWQGRDWTLDSWMAAYNVSGVMVLKDGQVVLARYGQGRRPTDRWVSQSVAKSVTSLLAGAAIRDGRLKLSDPVERYVPELKGSAYQGVTVRQLLMMSSGVKWAEGYVEAGQSDLMGYYRSALAGADQYAAFMARLPRAGPAGATFHYSTGEAHLTGLVVARAAGKPLAEYLSEKIWRPYGMERDAAWQVDPMGRELAGCCLFMTLSDYARLGQFVLDGGVIDGRAVTAPGWIAESTRRQIDNGRPAPAGYGYFWWIGADAYEASGIYGQSILVYPKDRVVISVNSQWAKPDQAEDFAALGAFQRSARDAARALSP